MEAVGQLAGGIAHDFNNLLLGIRGFTELARASLGPGTPAHDDLGEAIAATDRATLLTRQLLSFSREEVLKPVVVDPNAAVSGVVNLLDRLIGEKIRVKVDLQPDVPCVEADPGQLGQVIVNLAVNARDAMSTGGKLTIRTSYSNVGPFAAGRRIRSLGRHRGLGHRARNERGDAEADVRPLLHDQGRGRRHRARSRDRVDDRHEEPRAHRRLERAGHRHDDHDLPARDGQETRRLRAAARREPKRQVRERRSCSPTTTRQCERSPLERSPGWATRLAAANGREALQLVRPDMRIDLLVTDLDMPGLSGRELAAELGHLPVLYMSGHPRDLMDDSHEGEAHFIQKPFGMADLTRAVETVLAGRPSRAAA